MRENTTQTEGIISPKLRVSDHKKRAKDFEYTKAVMDNYIASGVYSDDYLSVDTKVRDVRIFYDAYNNKLPDAYFQYVTNPLNSEKPEYTNWPARMRPFTIIRPNIDLIEGEYEKRPLIWTVKVHNADAVNQVQEEKYNEILAALQQQFINSLNQKGMETGMDSQQVELPAKIKAKFESNYRDERAIMGEAALNIIIDDQDLINTWKRMFMDWLIAGECYSYKGISGSKVTYDRVSPLDIDYEKSPDIQYIEDGQWAVRRMFMTPAEVNDHFYKELTQSDIDIIEDANGHLTTRSIELTTQFTSREDEDLRRSKVPVYHVVWKYMTKVGVLTYQNEFGQDETMEVPETYKPQDGESVEWYWVNEVWEGYRISTDIYVGIQPIPNQRNTVNNMSECKLPYNGRRFSDTHSQNISIVEMGLAYETLHRILHFNLEKTIAKSKGKIAIMDINAIPNQNGWDEEKFFYWAEATGWGLINRNQPGADKNFNQYTVLDLGLYDHIANLIQLMEFVKSEWDEVLGITRQRKGETKSTDTVRGNQSAIAQSAVISEKVFSKFEEFVERELRGLLDTSKLAWDDSFQRMYQGDDMRNVLFAMDPIKYAKYVETDFGVYVSRSARDIQDLEMVKQQVQAFAQNGVSPATIIDVVQARSLSKLRTILQEAEAKSMEAQQGMQMNEAEAQERLEMIKQSFMEMQAYFEERKINLTYDREEDLELLKQSGVDQNPESTLIDPSAAQKVMLDDQNKKREIALKEKTEAVKAGQKNRELDLKEKELKVRKQIADKQASVALKNKVVGEKSKSKSK